MYQELSRKGTFFFPLLGSLAGCGNETQRQMNGRNTHTFMYVLQGVDLPEEGRLKDEAKVEGFYGGLMKEVGRPCLEGSRDKNAGGLLLRNHPSTKSGVKY